MCDVCRSHKSKHNTSELFSLKTIFFDGTNLCMTLLVIFLLLLFMKTKPKLFVGFFFSTDQFY